MILNKFSIWTLRYCLTSLFGLLSISAVVYADDFHNDFRFITTDMPPYSIASEQGMKPSGLLIDLINLVLKQWTKENHEAEILFMPWKRAQRSLLNVANSSKESLLFPVGRTPARESLYTWISPLLEEELRFYVINSEIDADITVEDLIHSDVGVLSSSSGFQLLEARGFSNIFSCRTVDICARMLNQGRIKAWLAPQAVKHFVFDRLGINNSFIIKGPLLKTVSFYMVGSQSLPIDVASFWRELIEKARKDPEYQKILTRYGSIK